MSSWKRNPVLIMHEAILCLSKALPSSLSAKDLSHVTLRFHMTPLQPPLLKKLIEGRYAIQKNSTPRLNIVYLPCQLLHQKQCRILMTHNLKQAVLHTSALPEDNQERATEWYSLFSVATSNAS